MDFNDLTPEERITKLQGYLEEKDARIEKLTKTIDMGWDTNTGLEREIESQTILIRELNEDVEEHRVNLRATQERLRQSRISNSKCHDEITEQNREIYDLKSQLGTKTTECNATVYGLGCMYDELKETRELVESWMKECKRLRTAEIK